MTDTADYVMAYSRGAQPGELCHCGRQAVQVFPPGVYPHPQGYCGVDNGGAPTDGWCVFCSNELSHDRPRVNDAGDDVGVFRQGERCPKYRLRLDMPVPHDPPQGAIQ